MLIFPNSFSQKVVLEEDHCSHRKNLLERNSQKQHFMISVVREKIILMAREIRLFLLFFSHADNHGDFEHKCMNVLGKIMILRTRDDL